MAVKPIVGVRPDPDPTKLQGPPALSTRGSEGIQRARRK